MSHEPLADRELLPIHRILVATDLSSASRLALSRAGQLAVQNAARLHLVHAQPDWNLFSRSGAGSAADYHLLCEQTDAGLAEEVQYLDKTFGLRVTCESRSGHASTVLRTTVAEFSPHLIVAGARGENESPRAAPFLGGTALKLIAFAGCPVLLVRQSGAAPYGVSLAAIESPNLSALALVRWARALAVNGECHVVHAFDAPYIARLRKRGMSDDALSAISDAARQAANEFVGEILSTCEASRGLSTHLVCGEPVHAVLAELERIRPDVAVVGKHGHPPIEMLSPAIGSVALRIAYHAACDVLVVPG